MKRNKSEIIYYTIFFSCIVCNQCVCVAGHIRDTA